MVIFPLLAAGVSAVFALILLRDYTQRHRVAQLAWGIALVQYAVASLAVAWGITQGWEPVSYKIFYLFGAALNVPWLALGSVALLGNRLLSLIAGALVAIATAISTVQVLGGTVTRTVALNDVVTQTIFGGTQIPSGKAVWASDPSVRTLAITYSLVAYALVVLIAVYTSRSRKGVAPPPDRVKGNLLIAVGVTINAIGGTALTQYARGSVFSVTLAVGVAVMFVGFLLASRAPRHHVVEPGDSPT